MQFLSDFLGCNLKNLSNFQNFANFNLENFDFQKHHFQENFSLKYLHNSNIVLIFVSVKTKDNRVMKKYLVITNNEKYYLIEAISSISAAKKLTSYLLKKNNVTLDEVFELIKNVENIIDLTKFNLED